MVVPFDPNTVIPSSVRWYVSRLVEGSWLSEGERAALVNTEDPVPVVVLFFGWYPIVVFDAGGITKGSTYPESNG